MRQTIFTLLLFCTIGLFSCRKDKFEPTIKQYDQTQILNYIKANHITGMVEDTVGGDTSGIWYKILRPGPQVTANGTPIPPMQYTDQISFIFTIKTFDGLYSLTDTLGDNHFEGFLGHVTNSNLPLGLQTALINDLKYYGGSMRVLVPSHLAYGVNGTGSGSQETANSHIAGNQCLDYYVNTINNQPAYDQQVIKSYMADTLKGYSETADGLWYKILTPGTGTDPITINSTITYTDTGQLFDAVIFDAASNGTTPGTADIDALIPGVQEGLINHAVTGTKISLLVPSALGYGIVAQSGIPANSCLRFTFIVQSTAP